MDAYWRAANYLSVGQIYLYDNPLLKKPLEQGARQAAAARPLGHHAGPELHLRPPQPRHQEARPEHDLHHRPGARRAGAGRQRLPRGHLQRGLPEHLRRTRRGMKRLFKQFSFPGGIPSHVAPGDAGLDPRGRRAGLRPLARLRRRLRQPRPDRRLRGRRRRGGDRAAGDLLALQQVPEPRDRRRGAAHPAPERLQDRQPLRAGPHQPRGARPALPRLRLHALLRRGRTSPRRCTSSWRRRSTPSSRRSAASRPTRGRTASRAAAALAHDRAAHAEGLDRPEGDRRQADRGLLALPPGADGRDAREPGPHHDPRGLDEELPAARSCSTPTARLVPELAALAPEGEPPHERQPARQRRRSCCRTCACPTSAPTPSKVPSPGAVDGRGDPRHGRRSCAT